MCVNHVCISVWVTFYKCVFAFLCESRFIHVYESRLYMYTSRVCILYNPRLNVSHVYTFVFVTCVNESRLHKQTYIYEGRLYMSTFVVIWITFTHAYESRLCMHMSHVVVYLSRFVHVHEPRLYMCISYFEVCVSRCLHVDVRLAYVFLS